MRTTPLPWKAEKWHDIKSTTIHGPDHLSIGNMKNEGDARFAVHAANFYENLLQELKNIAGAKRNDRKHFADDTEFADWAQSRARFMIAKAEEPMKEVTLPADL